MSSRHLSSAKPSASPVASAPERTVAAAASHRPQTRSPSEDAPTQPTAGGVSEQRPDDTPPPPTDAATPADSSQALPPPATKTGEQTAADDWGTTPKKQTWMDRNQERVRAVIKWFFRTLGLGVAGWTLYSGYQGIDGTEWKPAEATVKSAVLIPWSMARPGVKKLLYEYEVDGKTYTGWRMNVASPFIFNEPVLHKRMKTLLPQLYPGGTITVHYDAKRPERSCVEAVDERGVAWIFAGFAAVCTGITFGL